MEQRPPEQLLAMLQVQSEGQHVAVPEYVDIPARGDRPVGEIARKLQKTPVLELNRVNPLDIPALRKRNQEGDRLEVQLEDLLIERPSIERWPRSCSRLHRSPPQESSEKHAAMLPQETGGAKHGVTGNVHSMRSAMHRVCDP